MLYCGIDPGLNGAVVAIDERSQLIGYWDTPSMQIKQTGRREYLIHEMVSIIDRLRSAHFALEALQPMPGKSSNAMFGLGRAMAIWEGILTALRCSYERVRYQEWQRAMYRGIGGEGKARSILAAQRLFPQLQLVPPKCRKPRDGRADAALLAEYLRRMDRSTKSGDF